MAAYMATRREARRSKLIDLAGGKCQQCGSTNTLEFNHRDRVEKAFSLSGAGLDKAWDKILAELAKCELLCSECHARYTKSQYDNGEIIPWNKGRSQTTRLELTWEHGTARMYSERKCKCEWCRQAKRLYRNKIIGYNDVAQTQHSPVV